MLNKNDIETVFKAMELAGYFEGGHKMESIKRGILRHLWENDKATHKDLEVALNEQQPRINKAVNTLINKGLVERETKTTNGKGAPYNIYRLADDWTYTVGFAIDKKKRLLETAEEILTEVRK